MSQSRSNNKSTALVTHSLKIIHTGGSAMDLRSNVKSSSVLTQSLKITHWRIRNESAGVTMNTFLTQSLNITHSRGLAMNQQE